MKQNESADTPVGQLLLYLPSIGNSWRISPSVRWRCVLQAVDLIAAEDTVTPVY